jgi:hypothetical protein
MLVRRFFFQRGFGARAVGDRLLSAVQRPSLPGRCLAEFGEPLPSRVQVTATGGREGEDPTGAGSPVWRGGCGYILSGGFCVAIASGGIGPDSGSDVLRCYALRA